jgi:hypothetical protein
VAEVEALEKAIEVARGEWRKRKRLCCEILDTIGGWQWQCGSGSGQMAVAVAVVVAKWQ